MPDTGFVQTEDEITTEYLKESTKPSSTVARMAHDNLAEKSALPIICMCNSFVLATWYQQQIPSS